MIADRIVAIKGSATMKVANQVGQEGLRYLAHIKKILGDYDYMEVDEIICEEPAYLIVDIGLDGRALITQEKVIDGERHAVMSVIFSSLSTNVTIEYINGKAPAADGTFNSQTIITWLRLVTGWFLGRSD